MSYDDELDIPVRQELLEAAYDFDSDDNEIVADPWEGDESVQIDICPIPLEDMCIITDMIQNYQYRINESSDKFFDADDWALIHGTWLNSFNEISLEVCIGIPPLSDEMFVGMSMMKCCEHPEWRDERPNFVLTNLELRYLIVRHTKQAQDSMFDMNAIEDLKKRCMIHIVYDLCRTEDQLKTFIDTSTDTLNESSIAEERAYRFGIMKMKDMEETLKKEELEKLLDSTKLYTIRQLELHESKEVQEEYKKCTSDEEKEALRVKVFAELDKEDVNKGSLYWNTCDAYLDSFTRLCSRTFHYIDIHSSMLRRFPRHKIEVSYHILARKRFTEFIEVRSSYDMGSITSFRDFGLEMLLPLGSRVERYRKQSTMYNPAGAMDILQDEIGVYSAASLMELAETPITDIVKDPSHLFYAALVATIFDIMFATKCKQKFIEQYLVFPTELHSTKSQAKLFRDQYQGKQTRPVVAMIFNKWCVLIHKHRVECDDIIDAILKWMTLVRDEFGGKLEGHEVMTIHKFSDQFLSETGGVVDDITIDQQCKQVMERIVQKRKKWEF